MCIKNYSFPIEEIMLQICVSYTARNKQAPEGSGKVAEQLLPMFPGIGCKQPFITLELCPDNLE